MNIPKTLSLSRQQALDEIVDRIHAFDNKTLGWMLQYMIRMDEKLDVILGITSAPLNRFLSQCQQEKEEQHNREQYLNEHRVLVPDDEPKKKYKKRGFMTFTKLPKETK